MDDLNQALSELKLSEETGAASDGLDKLLKVLEAEGCKREECAKALLDQTVLPTLAKLLEKDASRVKTAQAVAELCKVELLREPAVKGNLVRPLVGMMSSKDAETCIQACRALGNICFDNDIGRCAVEECGGLDILLSMLKGQLGVRGEDATKLRMVACGFLLNLTNTHESLQERAVQEGALNTLSQCLSQDDDSDVINMALMAIGCLADCESGKKQVLECGLAVTVAGLLTSPAGTDLQDSILELLASMAESDDVKVQLANSGLPNDLLTLAKSSVIGQDDDCTSVIKLASDLLVLLLTGDASMEVLYDNGRGPVYQECVHWLQSEHDQLQICGALAMGNIARNDGHCVQLVQNGVIDTLLSLIHNRQDTASPILQHAVLSALRNLAIPGANKTKMIEKGVVKTVVPYLESDMAPVQFKLLGLLRMLVDKQEKTAKTLGTDKTVMHHLVEFTNVEDHAGVKGEASRLISSLVKHSHSCDVMRVLVNEGGIPPLVTMVNSEHTVMQNEALLALTLVASSILGDATQSLSKADLVPALKLQLTESESMPAELLCNALSLIQTLIQSEEMKQLMVIAELPALLKKFSSHSEDSVKSQNKLTLSLFSKR